MADRYLLPCPCGRKTVVEPRLAGQILPCECGTPLEVPLLSVMRRLERAADVHNETEVEQAWGTAQRVSLIGWIVFVFALGCAAALLINYPKPPRDFIDLQRARTFLETGLDNAPPAVTLAAWKIFSSQGLSDIPEEIQKSYHAQWIRFQFKLGGSILLALAGFGLVAGAHFAGRTTTGAEAGTQS